MLSRLVTWYRLHQSKNERTCEAEALEPPLMTRSKESEAPQERLSEAKIAEATLHVEREQPTTLSEAEEIVASVLAESEANRVRRLYFDRLPPIRKRITALRAELLRFNDLMRYLLEDLDQDASFAKGGEGRSLVDTEFSEVDGWFDKVEKMLEQQSSSASFTDQNFPDENLLVQSLREAALGLGGYGSGSIKMLEHIRTFLNPQYQALASKLTEIDREIAELDSISRTLAQYVHYTKEEFQAQGEPEVTSTVEETKETEEISSSSLVSKLGSLFTNSAKSATALARKCIRGAASTFPGCVVAKAKATNPEIISEAEASIDGAKVVMKKITEVYRLGLLKSTPASQAELLEAQTLLTEYQNALEDLRRARSSISGALEPAKIKLRDIGTIESWRSRLTPFRAGASLESYQVPEYPLSATVVDEIKGMASGLEEPYANLLLHKIELNRSESYKRFFELANIQARKGPEQQYLDLLLEHGAILALKNDKLPTFVIDTALASLGKTPLALSPQDKKQILTTVLWHKLDASFLSSWIQDLIGGQGEVSRATYVQILTSKLDDKLVLTEYEQVRSGIW